MAFTTLISSAEVAAHLDDPNWAIVDCRFALADPAKGVATIWPATSPAPSTPTWMTISPARSSPA
jgi:hypothetical protein